MGRPLWCRLFAMSHLPGSALILYRLDPTTLGDNLARQSGCRTCPLLSLRARQYSMSCSTTTVFGWRGPRMSHTVLQQLLEVAERTARISGFTSPTRESTACRKCVRVGGSEHSCPDCEYVREFVRRDSRLACRPEPRGEFGAGGEGLGMCWTENVIWLLMTSSSKAAAPAGSPARARQWASSYRVPRTSGCSRAIVASISARSGRVRQQLRPHRRTPRAIG